MRCACTDDISGDDPIPDPADCRDLALAIFQRAARDVRGRRLKGEGENPVAVRDEALEWIEQARVGFRFWCAVAGCDWRLVRERLLELSKDSGTGPLSVDRFPGGTFCAIDPDATDTASGWREIARARGF